MLYAADLITQYVPWYYILSNHLKNFSLPHWVDYIYKGGYPLLAQGETGALSPINILILFLFPFPLSINFLYIAYAAIALVGMYLFLKKSMNLSAVSSIYGSVIFSSSGFFITRYFQPSIIFSASFLPLGMFIVTNGLKNTKLLFFLPLIIYLQVTAGHLQIALISSTSYLLFAFVSYYKNKLYIVKIICFQILGYLLAAVQILPSISLFMISQRQEWAPLIRFSYSLHPSHLVTYLLPEYFGVSEPGDDFGFTQFGGGFWELNLTIWSIPFLLTICTFLLHRKIKHKMIASIIVLWIVAILISLGGFFKPNQIVAYLPNFPFRAPARFMLTATFAVTTLSAMGFEYLTKSLSNAPRLACLTVIILTLFIQVSLFLNNYFVFENTNYISATDQKLLKTPLEINKDKLSKIEDPSKHFKKSFKNGATISFLSLLVLVILFGRELNLSNLSFYPTKRK